MENRDVLSCSAGWYQRIRPVSFLQLHLTLYQRKRERGGSGRAGGLKARQNPCTRESGRTTRGIKESGGEANLSKWRRASSLPKKLPTRRIARCWQKDVYTHSFLSHSFTLVFLHCQLIFCTPPCLSLLFICAHRLVMIGFLCISDPQRVFFKYYIFSRAFAQLTHELFGIKQLNERGGPVFLL